MNGEMGECPAWYELLQAAKYLSVAPWDLMEQSIWWKHVALKAITAEAQAQKIVDDRK